MKSIITKLENGWQLAHNEYGNYFIVNRTTLHVVQPDTAKKLINKGYRPVALDATEYAANSRKLAARIDEVWGKANAVVIREYQMIR